MDEEAVNKDIELYLTLKMESDTGLSRFGMKTKEMIISSIVVKSGGM